jgi:hypothetical protein
MSKAAEQKDIEELMQNLANMGFCGCYFDLGIDKSRLKIVPTKELHNLDSTNETAKEETR